MNQKFKKICGLIFSVILFTSTVIGCSFSQRQEEEPPVSPSDTPSELSGMEKETIPSESNSSKPVFLSGELTQEDLSSLFQQETLTLELPDEPFYSATLAGYNDTSVFYIIFAEKNESFYQYDCTSGKTTLLYETPEYSFSIRCWDVYENGIVFCRLMAPSDTGPLELEVWYVTAKEQTALFKAETASFPQMTLLQNQLFLVYSKETDNAVTEKLIQIHIPSGATTELTESSYTQDENGLYTGTILHNIGSFGNELLFDAWSLEKESTSSEDSGSSAIRSYDPDSGVFQTLFEQDVSTYFVSGDSDCILLSDYAYLFNEDGSERTTGFLLLLEKDGYAKYEIPKLNVGAVIGSAVRLNERYLALNSLNGTYLIDTEDLSCTLLGSIMDISDRICGYEDSFGYLNENNEVVIWSLK